MVCLGFEPGTQDGRRRRNHGAMAAVSHINSLLLSRLQFESSRVNAKFLTLI